LKYLLDTNIILELLRDQEKAEKGIFKLWLG